MADVLIFPQSACVRTRTLHSLQNAPDKPVWKAPAGVHLALAVAVSLALWAGIFGVIQIALPG